MKGKAEKVKEDEETNTHLAFGEKANKKSENPFGEKASRATASSSSRRRLAAHGSSEKIVPQMSTIKEPKSETPRFGV